MVLLLAGNSVCVFVYGFEPYFYVEAPPNFSPDDCWTIQRHLNVSTFLMLCFLCNSCPYSLPVRLLSFQAVIAPRVREACRESGEGIKQSSK